MSSPTGQRFLLSADQAGDEPRLLAETLPGVPVLTGIVRRFPAQAAIDRGADLLLLDDGFQHLQIRRDVNLVLFNTDRLAGNSRVFPGGDLREPVAALARATHFAMTGVREDNQDRAGRFGELLQTRIPGIPVAHVGYGVAGVVQLNPAALLEPIADAPLQQGKWFGFAGIAHPQSFRKTLETSGVELAGFQALDDHQHYTSAVLGKLTAQAVSANAIGLVTTEKDLVKLAPGRGELPMPLYGLRMEVKASPTYLQSIISSIASKNSPRSGGKGAHCVKMAQLTGVLIVCFLPQSLQGRLSQNVDTSGNLKTYSIKTKYYRNNGRKDFSLG